MQNALPIDFEKLKVAKRAHTTTRCVCSGCGVVFWRKLTARNKGLYHSRQCAFDHHAVGGNRRKPKPKQPKPLPIRVCVTCGKESATRQRACSPECERLYVNQKQRAYMQARRPRQRERACRECGRLFTPTYGSKRRHFCLPQCERRATRRIGRAIRRARKQQAHRERVDPIAVLRRDRYRCQLCGRSTPARLRGRMVDNAPEIDHIVPLSQGGSHTYDNVQCACRKCNGRKSVAVRGQLRLVI